MNADKIIVIRGGKTIQDGMHEELIKQEGEYKKLWNLQKVTYSSTSKLRPLTIQLLMQRFQSLQLNWKYFP